MNERLKIGLPTGELEKDVLSFAKTIGLNFPEPGRKYLIQATNMPLDFVVLRASEIPEIVKNEDSSVKVGITGSDIIWESGANPQASLELPLNKVLGKKNVSSLFVGVTDEFRSKILKEKGREPLITDLLNHAVVTKFPFITKALFSSRGIPDLKIRQAQGKTEAIQHVYWDAFGLVDVVDTGNTLKANQIWEVERFHEVSVRILENLSGLDQQRQNILADLKEKIYLAEKRSISR